MVTVYDVAQRAGVSIATVSRALNDRARISSETRQQVLDAARQLGHQPNDRARGLVGMVTVDHRAGARTAVEHLVELGHRRIAHLAGPMDVVSGRERRAGWRDALVAAGLEPDPALVVEGDFLEDGGYEAARELMSRGDFTAVFAANDLSAIGLLRGLAESGVRVPEDVSVVGFDGVHLAAYPTPRLTTVVQPVFELGRRAAELLLDRVVSPPSAGKEPETVILGTSLVVRDSTGRAPQPEVEP